jgi:HEAT repeat protein
VWPALLRQWPLVAAAAWLAIAVAAVAWYGIRLRRVYRALGSGSAATDLLDTVDVLRQSANQRRPIRLTKTSGCPVPLALGGRHIVLPDRFFDELDPEQQHAALAHEVAHVARRDPEWRVALEIIGRALFFQPFNRLARARLSESAEFLCDEWAVQQTQSPLAMARCLSVVGSWWSPSGELSAGVSAMARSDSAMVRRVTRILDEAPRVSSRPRLAWLLIPVALVAIAAPRITATQLPAALVASTTTAVIPKADATHEPQRALRDWTPADVAQVQSRVRDHRTGGTLDERWRQAMSEAAKQRLADFWMVYAFNANTRDRDLIYSDSRDGGFTISADGQIFTNGPPLAAVLSQGAVPLEGGRVAVVVHYRGARADAADHGGYLSPSFGFDFGRAPIFWLGDASETESFARVQELFGQTKQQNMQELLVELASLHSDSNAVIPFLARLVDRPWPPQIREEAVEGFERHHDPRSVEILLRVARTDPDPTVRSEAAESIGEVQVPQAIPALTELARESDDANVRREAAEGFGAQPAAQAIPAIETLLRSTNDEAVLDEAIEALGELGDASVIPLLLQIARTHDNGQARQEAVETIGDIDAPDVVEALSRLAWDEQDPEVRNEAIETLGDRKDDAAAMGAIERIVREHPSEDAQVEAIETLAEMSEEALPAQIVALAESGRSARIRREAVEQIADALDKIADLQTLDTAEQLLERVIYNDADAGVRMEALDAIGELPSDRAGRALRKIADGHPDARVRREAAEHLRK